VKPVEEQSDAERLGIDLNELETERFYTRRHRAEMAAHNRRRAEYERRARVFNDWLDFSRAKVESFPARLGRPPEDKPEKSRFTDEQMRIAIKSLERKGKV